MAIVLDRNDHNKVVELGEVLLQSPRQVFLTGALDLFEDEFISQKTVEIRRETRQNRLAVDRNWDERNSNTVGGQTSALQLKIPHFPIDDAIKVGDIDGQVSVNSMQEFMGLAQVGEVRAKKMTQIMGDHDLTKEYARMQLISQGTVYAPEGTLRTSYGPTVNYYTEFNIVRPDIQITTFAGVGDPRAEIESCRRAVIAGARGAAGIPRVLALCGSDYFNALASNAFVTDAVKYQNFAGLSRPLLVGRPEENPFNLSTLFRTLDLWGVTFIDVGEAGYTDAETGTFVPFLSAKEARFIPQGLRGVFKTYYAPAQKFTTINKRAQAAYWFEYPGQKDEKIEIESEQNFLNALLYPGAVVRSWIA